MICILVNFSENNNFGCDEHCSFCEWQKINYNKYYYPTDEELYQLHLQHPDELWQISGGGDPLYHFEINGDKIKHIADFGHKLGHKIEILTRKTDVALQYYEELKEYIDYWYFSVPDIPSTNFIDFTKKQSIIKVNSILNFEEKDIDLERIEKIYYNYEPYVNRIIFRENFIHRLEYTDKEKRSLYIKLKEKYPKIRLIFKNKAPALFNGETENIRQIDMKYLKTKE